MRTEDALGTLSPFTCPESSGALWEIKVDGLLRFRRHAGHAYTGETILAARQQAIEEMLWKLVRTHQERAALARRMADEEARQNRHNLAQVLRSRANEYEDAAVRRLIHVGIPSGVASTEDAE